MNEKNVRALIHAFHDYTKCNVCPFAKECGEQITSYEGPIGCENFLYKMLTEQEDN